MIRKRANLHGIIQSLAECRIFGLKVGFIIFFFRIHHKMIVKDDFWKNKESYNMRRYSWEKRRMKLKNIRRKEKAYTYIMAD